MDDDCLFCGPSGTRVGAQRGGWTGEINVEHILELYCASSAIFTFAFLALASRAANWPCND
jgi:hypothetical protein